MYHKLKEKPTVYFDVDSTLVFTQAETPIDPTLFNMDNYITVNEGEFKRVFTVHDKHVECIKDFKARGHNVVVWSAGGADWASLVIDNLGLQEYIDVIMPKPDWYFDDLEVSKWMTNHCYIGMHDFNPLTNKNKDK